MKLVKLIKFTVNLDLVAGFLIEPEMEKAKDSFGRDLPMRPTGRSLVTLKLSGVASDLKLEADDSEVFLRVLHVNQDSLYLGEVHNLELVE